MKKLKLIFILNLTCLMACAKEGNETLDTTYNARIVGYLFANSNLLEAAKKVDFSKITHLNIAFINPNANGAFPMIPQLKEVVTLAHAAQVKVLSSLAGGNPPGHLRELLKPQKRQQLVDSLVALVDNYALDGIDVDLEGDFINDHYEPFVLALAAQLKPKGKLLTAAVATWSSYSISDNALAVYDFINIMSYDHTGPWRKEKPGPHSTFEQMDVDFKHWNLDRKIAANKLVIGLPFYGYGFGEDIPDDIMFKDLVEQFPEAAYLDELLVPNRGTYYYNGIPTIRKKTDYVIERKAGGLMIWHLSADSAGEYSLLQTIQNSLLKKN